MAPWTPKRLVSNALENLSEVNFKKFLQALMDRKVDGRRMVLRNQVENKGFLEVADVLVGVCTEKKVVSVAVEILRDIGCSQEAEELAEEAGFNSTCAAGSSSSSAAGSDSCKPATCNEEHFVDKHRVELIQRVTNISAILDQLLNEKVITCEIYDTIRSKPTNSEKMRAIYNSPINTTRATKDIFYNILKQQEKFLIDDLEGN